MRDDKTTKMRLCNFVPNLFRALRAGSESQSSPVKLGRSCSSLAGHELKNIWMYLSLKKYTSSTICVIANCVNIQLNTAFKLSF